MRGTSPIGRGGNRISVSLRLSVVLPPDECMDGGELDEVGAGPQVLGDVSLRREVGVRLQAAGFGSVMVTVP